MSRKNVSTLLSNYGSIEQAILDRAIEARAVVYAVEKKTQARELMKGHKDFNWLYSRYTTIRPRPQNEEYPLEVITLDGQVHSVHRVFLKGSNRDIAKFTRLRIATLKLAKVNSQVVSDMRLEALRQEAELAYQRALREAKAERDKAIAQLTPTEEKVLAAKARLEAYIAQKDAKGKNW